MLGHNIFKSGLCTLCHFYKPVMPKYYKPIMSQVQHAELHNRFRQRSHSITEVLN